MTWWYICFWVVLGSLLEDMKEGKGPGKNRPFFLENLTPTFMLKGLSRVGLTPVWGAGGAVSGQILEKCL